MQLELQKPLITNYPGIFRTKLGVGSGAIIDRPYPAIFIHFCVIVIRDGLFSQWSSLNPSVLRSLLESLLGRFCWCPKRDCTKLRILISRCIVCPSVLEGWSFPWECAPSAKDENFMAKATQTSNCKMCAWGCFDWEPSEAELSFIQL